MLANIHSMLKLHSVNMPAFDCPSWHNAYQIENPKTPNVNHHTRPLRVFKSGKHFMSAWTIEGWHVYLNAAWAWNVGELLRIKIAWSCPHRATAKTLLLTHPEDDCQCPTQSYALIVGRNNHITQENYYMSGQETPLKELCVPASWLNGSYVES